jgi:hypothetical protein
MVGITALFINHDEERGGAMVECDIDTKASGLSASFGVKGSCSISLAVSPDNR